MEAEILETKIVASQNAVPKRLSDDHVSEDVSYQIQLKKPRILDFDDAIQYPPKNLPLETALVEISRFEPNIKHHVKRIFPGPAGVESQLHYDSRTTSTLRVSSNVTRDIERITESRTEYTSLTDSFFTSQQLTVDCFDQPAWRKMKEDMSNNLTEEHIRLLDKFSISWMLKKVEKNINFCTKKIPFLSVVLVSIKNEESYSHRGVFQDLTGNISGSIHHKVAEKYCSAFHPGSVLVLRQFGIFSPVLGKHYIVVTENNVVCIYDPDTDGNVNCIEVQNLPWVELAKEAEESIKEANNGNESLEKKTNANFLRKTGENLPLNQMPGIQVQAQQPTKPSLLSLNSASCDKFPSTSKKFVFKKITPLPHESEKNTETSLTSSLSLDLFTGFDEGEWKDDEFESLVKNMNM
ncbi:hypothetical protein CHUAL_007340 [Chamberlinius hualienensis]